MKLGSYRDQKMKNVRSERDIDRISIYRGRNLKFGVFYRDGDDI